MAKKRKGAEKRIPHFAKKHKLYFHKYKDVQLCIHCHKPQPKSKSMPDYLLTPIPIYVEVKESGQDERFNFKHGMTDVQREFFSENPGFIFLEMGSGNAPNGKSAYMIPTPVWFISTDNLIATGYGSFSREESARGCPGTEILFSKYKCVWEEGGWNIPWGHIFWLLLKSNVESYYYSVFGGVL